MKLISRMKSYKRILAAVFIILLVVCVEAGFNYPALIEGYEELDISAYIEVEGKKDEQNYIIQYGDPEGLYVKQLELRGIFPGADYTVEITALNDFGKEEVSEITDSVHPWFNEFYTNIDKRITSLKITMPKKYGSVFWTASLSNQVEINKYRVAFTLITLLLGYCIFFEKVFRKKPEYYFLLFALSFGGLLLFADQPQCNAWDEQVHFQNAYRLASGPVVEWNEAAELMGASRTVKCNTKTEYAQLRNVMDEKGEVPTYVENRTSLGLNHASLSYIPMAVFLKLGMMMKLPFSDLVMVGRIGNLIAYIVVMFLAIRLAERKKLFLLFVALMPTSIFLACSYSYDSMAFSLITLGSVLWANEMFVRRETYRMRAVVASFLLLVIGSLTKIVYLPIVLVLILLPQIKQIERKKKRIGATVGLVVCGLAVIFVWTQWLQPILNGELFFSDLRGGETSFAGQLVSMLQHPMASVKMLVKDIFNLENFRNSGNIAYNNFFVGNLMFLNYYLLGVMSDKWCLLIIPVILVLLLYREQKELEQKPLQGNQRVFIGIVLVVAMVLVWISMYLAFTPVGDDQIAGVQARYYLPLLYLIALIISNKKIYVQISSGTVTKLTMCSALVLEMVSLYDFILKGRLI